MDLDRLKAIIDWMANSPLSELELTDGDFHIHLVKTAEGVVTTAAAAAVSARAAVTAPSFGVVHLAPSAGGEPFVKLGQRVEAGQTLCVIEAMKVFSPLEAEEAGTIAAILVETGAEVTAGQALFQLEP